ncbi:hypothetical protein [Streptacidiphilus sp. EB103A]|uniref:hypothetical protein n=1 Tax=Streptacidiphilus sp. EB103A TaxID=3156275 RepID=UPI0035174E4D
MSEVFTRRLGGSQVEQLTRAIELAARSGRIDARLTDVGRQAARGRGRVARLAAAVTDLLQALASTQDRERHRVNAAVQVLREPLTAVKAHVQVLNQVPDLPPQARAALLADLGSEVTRLSVELDALAATVGHPAPSGQRR